MKEVDLGPTLIQYNTEEHLLTVTIRPGTYVDMILSEKQYSITMDLVGTDFYTVMVITEGEVDIAKEVREFGSSEKALRQVIATAIMMNSVAARILGNFYLRVNNPGKPTKLFSDRLKAMEWLKEQRKSFEMNR